MVVSNIFIFTPTWGDDPIWLNGLKPLTIEDKAKAMMAELYKSTNNWNKQIRVNHLSIAWVVAFWVLVKSWNSWKILADLATFCLHQGLIVVLRESLDVGRPSKWGRLSDKRTLWNLVGVGTGFWSSLPCIFWDACPLSMGFLWS